MGDKSAQRENIRAAVQMAKQYEREAALEHAADHPAPPRQPPAQEQVDREKAGREAVYQEAARGLPAADRDELIREDPPFPVGREAAISLAANATEAIAVTAKVHGHELPHAEEIHQAIEHGVNGGLDGAIKLAGDAKAQARQKVQELIRARQERRRPEQPRDRGDR